MKRILLLEGGGVVAAVSGDKAEVDMGKNRSMSGNDAAEVAEVFRQISGELNAGKAKAQEASADLMQQLMCQSGIAMQGSVGPGPFGGLLGRLGW